ncbi:17 kDa surface antigen [Caballeronia turbans]|jgi:outer membrane lipoprotein SlyB|uniref:glycine zipper 2TM domain-containing protein n=1 Tax=unclassified Caballeronia TaxID=2646786 RepID=UPI00074B9727|nr:MULTISPECIES: glycine zipper 2TM domain-containing protein [unclassified Caballeronia]SAL56000.1 17 kDa surface antigen [Caballeronia turbans]
MKTVSRIALAMALVGSVALTGCAYNSSSSDVYTASQAQREETVRMATIESVRGVKISSNNGQPTGLGTIGGGALGGVAAASAIGGGNGSIIAGIIGGLAGAVAGNAVENSVAMKNGLEITVRLDNGDLRAITQTANGEVFQAGERVRLLSSGGVTRVTH